MVHTPQPLRSLAKGVYAALASTLEAYTGSSFNLLDHLANCSDGVLFCWVALARVSLLLFMWFSRTIAPVLFRGPMNSFIFDTGEELYDDPRFAMVRHWDGVHIFFIAQVGYLYENQAVFFPGLPAIIRSVQYVTQQCLPLLHALAPVSFYICVLNVLASCLAGVVLRRLSLLTLLGPEAVQGTCQWWRRRGGAAHITATAGECEIPLRELKRVTEATARYRLLYGLTGTSLDIEDPVAPPLASMKAVTALLRRRRRVVGAAALLWILTPSMVFTVAVYTESLFSLTTILAVYWLAAYEPLPWRVQESIAAHLSAGSVTTRWESRRTDRPGRDSPMSDSTDATPTPTPKKDAEALAPPLDELLGELTDGCRQWPRVEWRQALTTRAELGAVLLLTLAATLRSNAFTCIGFLLFPVVVQLCLPELHAAQCNTVLAGQRAAAILSRALAPATRSPAKAREDDVFSTANPTPPGTPKPSDARRVICTALTCPQRRLPHPLRVAVILFESAVIVSPYMAVNYVGYHRFVTTMWSASARAKIGNSFWQLYPTLQKKYWNVSFLSAYTFTNLPNVILALPVVVVLVMCANTYYLRTAWELRAGAPPAVRRVSLWSRVCAAVTPLVRSSNLVHLFALLTLALSKMHVQVTNRFVMSSPAVYWLMGLELATRPTSLLSQIILLWSIQWSITGAALFANHLPWT